MRRPGDTTGTESRLETLRGAAKTRFRMDEWMGETDVERALAELLTGHAGEPVTVGDYDATVDGTECGYLLRVFFQTRPLMGSVAKISFGRKNSASAETRLI